MNVFAFSLSRFTLEVGVEAVKAEVVEGVKGVEVVEVMVVVVVVVAESLVPQDLGQILYSLDCFVQIEEESSSN